MQKGLVLGGAHRLPRVQQVDESFAVDLICGGRIRWLIGVGGRERKFQPGEDLRLLLGHDVGHEEATFNKFAKGPGWTVPFFGKGFESARQIIQVLCPQGGIHLLHRRLSHEVG